MAGAAIQAVRRRREEDARQRIRLIFERKSRELIPEWIVQSRRGGRGGYWLALAPLLERLLVDRAGSPEAATGAYATKTVMRILDRDFGFSIGTQQIRRSMSQHGMGWLLKRPPRERSAESRLRSPLAPGGIVHHNVAGRGTVLRKAAGRPGYFLVRFDSGQVLEKHSCHLAQRTAHRIAA